MHGIATTRPACCQSAARAQNAKTLSGIAVGHRQSHVHLCRLCQCQGMSIRHDMQTATCRINAWQKLFTQYLASRSGAPRRSSHPNRTTPSKRPVRGAATTGSSAAALASSLGKTRAPPKSHQACIQLRSFAVWPASSRTLSEYGMSALDHLPAQTGDSLRHNRGQSSNPAQFPAKALCTCVWVLVTGVKARQGDVNICNAPSQLWRRWQAEWQRRLLGSPQ